MKSPERSVSTAENDLLSPFQSGRLAARYPLVKDHLASLAESELVRAGHLLSRVDPAEVLRHHPATPTVSVAVTGHGTFSSLLPHLTAEIARHGVLLRPFFSNYDSYVFELSDPGSPLYRTGADLTLCLLDPMLVLDDLPVPWTPADVDQALTARIGVIERLVEVFEATSAGTLVLNTLPLPWRFSAQLVDYRSKADLGIGWRRANTRLLQLMTDHPQVVVVDLDPVVADGVPVTDARLSTYAKAHLSPLLLARYAREIGHLARAATGRSKKCLVVDLDGTLWGGVLGDDGVEGIDVGGSYRGEAFQVFQGVVKQLGSQGVLVAAVSKNERDLVHRAFQERAEMVLRDEDLARIVASWSPKHEMLAELAATLNLGLDSFVFVDDSAYECGLVRRELPMVTTIQVGEDPAGHTEAVLRDGWFGLRELTAEDRTRGEKYRQEIERKNFLDNFDSLGDYLRELKVTVRLAGVGEPEISRVSQLTLRTNQFNMTTRRLQRSDVRSLLSEPGTDVLAIHAADRFGDHGLVGAVFLRRTDRDLYIDNFLLSCRVFSRGIEQGCLAAILDHAREATMEAVHGFYRPSARNGLVEDFYTRNGFVRVGEEGPVVIFRNDLLRPLDRPEHLTLHEEFGKEAP